MIFNKYINRYYLKYLHFFLIGIISVLIIDYVQLLIPEVIGKIIDQLKDETLTKTVLISLLSLVLIYAFIIVIGRFIWRYTILGTAKKIETDMREQLYTHSLKLDQTYYSDHKVGQIMAYFGSDLDLIGQSFGMALLMIIDIIFLISLSFYKMMRLDLTLSIFALIPLLLIALYGFLVGKIMRPRSKKMQDSFAALTDFTQESFTGINVIKAFVKQKREYKDFLKANQDYKDKSLSYIKVTILINVLINATIILMIIFILGYGGYLVMITKTLPKEQQFTIGRLNEYINYFTTLIWPMLAIGQFINIRNQAKGALARLVTFFDEKIIINDNQANQEYTSINGEIEFRDLSFKYDDNKNVVLDNINLKINQGESVGLIGKTGCGKSTLMDLLLRVYNVNDNTILLDGVDINHYPLKVIRSNMAIVLQDTSLFSKKIKDNIMFGLDNPVDEETLIQYATYADIHDNIMGFSDKYETVIGERGVTLSGGQKQRIAIARAFIRDAKILILDDAVSAVDFKTEEKILESLKIIRENKTTIIIAHRISTIKDLDKIVLLDEGKIVGVGTHKELLKKSELYKDMVKRQKLEDEIKEVA